MQPQELLMMASQWPYFRHWSHDQRWRFSHLHWKPALLREQTVDGKHKYRQFDFTLHFITVAKIHYVMYEVSQSSGVLSFLFFFFMTSCFVLKSLWLSSLIPNWFHPSPNALMYTVCILLCPVSECPFVHHSNAFKSRTGIGIGIGNYKNWK